MDIFAKRFAQSSFSFGKRPFVLKWVVSGVDRKWRRVLSAWRSPRSWLTFHSFLKCNGTLWRRHALHYPRAYLLHLWGFCYLASLQNDLCAGSNRYTSSSNLIKCQRQNGSWECQMSGIQNQADKHIFSSVPKCQASLKYKVVGNILEIVCNIFAIFLNVCLDILIPYNVWNFMWNRHK